jgi:hypothetical protein
MLNFRCGGFEVIVNHLFGGGDFHGLRRCQIAAPPNIFDSNEP